MLESSKVGINFAGKDGFFWFIGQVTADYAWRDKNNQNVELGYRAKVRILGHHPPESAEEGGIDDEDLPWAHFLVSPQFGSGHNRGGTSFGLQGGETVFGFFLDGEEGQQPIVVGLFHANSTIEPLKTWEKVLGGKSSGFGPFTADKSLEVGKHITGSHGKVPIESGGIIDSDDKIVESKVAGDEGVKKPEETTEQFHERTKGNAKEHGKIQVINQVLHDKPETVEVAQKCITPGGAMGEVSKVLQSFVDEVSGLEQFQIGTQEMHIDPVLNRIVDMDKLISKASNKIAGGFSATIRQARKEMLKEVDTKVSEAVNFLDPSHLIKNLEVRKQTDQVYCLIENVINGLKDFVGDFLKGMVGNLLQFPLCAAEQFLGGLISGISDKIQGMIGPALSSISSLAGGISLPPFGDMMGKALNIAQAGLALLECEGNECEPEPLDWKTNMGPDPKKMLDFGRMKGLASGLSSLGGLGDAIKDPMGALGGMFPGIGVPSLSGAVSGALGGGVLGGAVGGALGGGGISGAIGGALGGGALSGTAIGGALSGVGGALAGATGAISQVQGIAGTVSTLKGALSGGIPGGMANLVGGCDPFTKNCGSPKLSIFGGGGSGAVGKAVINSIGKVVGVNMTSLGSGFKAPPFVTITDNCDNGKGATATADIDLDKDSPTYGQIKDIIITNTGGGYVGPGVIDTVVIDDETGEETTVPTGTTTLPDGTVIPIITGGGSGTADDDGIDVIGEVGGIQVLTPGIGYKPGDTITTPSGGVITPIIDERGRILGADPSTQVDVGLIDIPKLTINTSTGFGAIIRPITRFTKVQDYEDPIVPEAKLIRVVDCPRGF